jgi:hypothetical protein
MRQRRWWRQKRRQEEPVEPRPVSFPVIDIRVSDDGFTLTGRRYAGYLAEVLKRQSAGIAQDVVTIWHLRPDVTSTHTRGMPKVNTAGELEIYEIECLRGTVRSTDGALRFFPA